MHSGLLIQKNILLNYLLEKINSNFYLSLKYVHSKVKVLIKTMALITSYTDYSYFAYRFLLYL